MVVLCRICFDKKRKRTIVSCLRTHLQKNLQQKHYVKITTEWCQLLVSYFATEYLLLWWHLLTISDLLFTKLSPLCIAIANFSFKHNIHLFEHKLYDSCIPMPVLESSSTSNSKISKPTLKFSTIYPGSFALCHKKLG